MQNDKLFLLFQFIPQRGRACTHTHTHTQILLEYGLCCSTHLAQNTATVVTMVTLHTTKQLGSQPTKTEGWKEGTKERKKERKKERDKQRKKDREKERRKERKTGKKGREGGCEEGAKDERKEGGREERMEERTEGREGTILSFIYTHGERHQMDQSCDTHRRNITNQNG